MNTKSILMISALMVAMTSAPAWAGGKGGGGRGSGSGVCPIGNVPGSGLCGGSGACDGTQQRLRLRDGSCVAPSGAPATAQGNPAATGTPRRDGSGKSTAPGQGAKDGTGNQPRHPTTPSTQG
ncbi:MAG: hypothetical protein IAE82_17945 [Opitutaceae bacterium]|nr:hypothetical protein [Opitutaceae bacterium]